jgi:hypothetical protein
MSEYPHLHRWFDPLLDAFAEDTEWSAITGDRSPVFSRYHGWKPKRQGYLWVLTRSSLKISDRRYRWLSEKSRDPNGQLTVIVWHDRDTTVVECHTPCALQVFTSFIKSLASREEGRHAC